MDLFARLLVAVWNNFDVLEDYIIGSQCKFGSNTKDIFVNQAPRTPTAPIDILAGLEVRFMNQRYGRTLDLETLHDTMNGAAHPAHLRGVDDEPLITVTAGSTLHQRMTTTRAAAIESLTRKDAVEIQEGIMSERMRQFDFSLDDLLVQQPSVANMDPFAVVSDRPKVVGVARWKIFDPANTCPISLIPGSVNPLQAKARLSSYPLVHLFTPPDILCINSAQENWQNLARRVARHSTAAAEFMMDLQSTKERKLYHRWMAAWHARSSHSPTETLARFELRQKSWNRETRASQRRKDVLRQRLTEVEKSITSTPDGDYQDASRFLNKVLYHIEFIKQRRCKEKPQRHPTRSDWTFGLPSWTDPEEEKTDLDEGDEGKGPSTRDAFDGLQGMRVGPLAELENAIRANLLSDEEQAILQRHFSQGRVSTVSSNGNSALLQLLGQL
ncbi:hypothetical protein CPC16_005463 [Podila verticillata]|nr:hypothetical protein CPC16_005463 [Podila verticillata]